MFIKKKQDKKKVFFITGGATGGHIYPALSVIESLLQEEEKNEVFYLGNKNKLEGDIIGKIKNVGFLNIEFRAMPRKIGFEFFAWSFQLFFCTIKSMYFIFKYKPLVIFATGGYVSAAPLIAGIVTHKKIIMHDCDAKPGLVSKVLSPFADKMTVVFEEQKKYLKCQNIFVTGNPVRKSFFCLNKQEVFKKNNLEEKMTIFAFGGSQGASTINIAVVNILEELLSQFDVNFVFQTGKKNFDNVINEIKNIFPSYKNFKNLIIRPYFDNIDEILTMSSISISRSGSLSLSEICASKTASILVPYPFAANNHQFFNAKIMQQKQASVIIEDKDLEPKKLKTVLFDLISDPSKIENMQNNAFKLAKPEALNRIVDLIKSLTI